MTAPTNPKIKHSNTDVLIIGAGPSGLMAATWLARAGVPFRIIDKRSNEIFSGQADGLQCRSLEVLKSFSGSTFDMTALDSAWKMGNHMIEMCFWSPDENGQLVRSGRIPDTIPGISRFQQVVIHQGYIEKWFEESIKHFSGNEVHVERPYLPLNISIDETAAEDQDAYAVEVLVKDLSKDNLSQPEQFSAKVANGLYRQFEGDQEKFYANLSADLENDPNANTEDYEVIHCKYVLGSDGAHSWVRKQLGIDMDGETTDFVWGVLDMVPITDFPDIRNRCGIHSKDSGSVMVIPRENDLVRFYIQLKEVDRDPATKTDKAEYTGNVNDKKASTKGRIDRSKITPELILKNAQEIMKPFKLEMTDLHWFTGYQIGQRVSPRFDKLSRVFISGDACHTHSPKAGQGMNVSMMDTFNLGFKLALVCKGLAKLDILKTYESERLGVARDLIAFDHKLSRMFSGKPMIPNSKTLEEGVDMDEFHKAFLKGNEFASGTIVDYADSILVDKSNTEEPDSDGRAFSYFASKVPVGRRLQTNLILAQADGRPYHIVDRLLSDGRFRVLIFPGDVKAHPENLETLNKFDAYLQAKDHFSKKYTPVNALDNSVIDVITIHATNRHDVEIFDFPEFTRPVDFKGRRDYWRLYSGVGPTYHEGDVDAYEAYGIDKKKGAIIIVRPDGYVSKVTEYNLGGLDEVGNYFERFMIPQEGKVLPKRSIDVDDTDRFTKPLLAV
ncbi:phenol 2-monooxygenase [Scheffersomyces xylosifermentans]|uniref:phenol 2-monooxygenase n=1 Tax=Scheffersomyces xylosifermentans TaxID=1304137 RepID=UPI00315DEECF